MRLRLDGGWSDFEFVLFLFWQSPRPADTSRRSLLAGFQAGCDLRLSEHQEHGGVYHRCLLRWMYGDSAEEAAKGDKVRRKTIALALCLSSCQPGLIATEWGRLFAIPSIPDLPARQAFFWRGAQNTIGAFMQGYSDEFCDLSLLLFWPANQPAKNQPDWDTWWGFLFRTCLSDTRHFIRMCKAGARLQAHNPESGP